MELVERSKPRSRGGVQCYEKYIETSVVEVEYFQVRL